ncbi:aminoacrylate peracid reductase [Bradyrhizobium sp. AZCC 2262]|uniref:Rid family hydrolase n=1 Tax=Bradyrhizobium sp. AZCC 2262 TaxID=3117022 RepID=UPI002FF28A84
MPIEAIIPPSPPPALAPYSAATKAGGFIYVSGTVAMGPKGESLGEGDAREQTRIVIESIKATIEVGGGTLKNVVFNQIFLKDLKDYAKFNEVYREYWTDHLPARYCIQAELVRPEFLVEIATTAYVGP